MDCYEIGVNSEIGIKETSFCFDNKQQLNNKTTKQIRRNRPPKEQT